jgi:hypothetical protein
MFGDVERLARLDAGEIDRAERELTRLTAANKPALKIIRLLQDRSDWHSILRNRPVGCQGSYST